VSFSASLVQIYNATSSPARFENKNLFLSLKNVGLHKNHRNLSTRTCMFELLLQTFWAKKKTCKKSADLHPRQGNLLQWNIFTGLNKTYLHFTK
jgi:hypothetical protein